MQPQQTPFVPVDQTGVVIDGLDIGETVSGIMSRGYEVVPDFLTREQIERVRIAFNTEVPITEMRSLGSDTGNTWRAHNLLAKTRAADFVFLDERVRAIVEGVIGPETTSSTS